MKKINNKKKRTLRNRKKLKRVSVNKYRVSVTKSLNNLGWWENIVIKNEITPAIITPIAIAWNCNGCVWHISFSLSLSPSFRVDIAASIEVFNDRFIV